MKKVALKIGPTAGSAVVSMLARDVTTAPMIACTPNLDSLKCGERKIVNSAAKFIHSVSPDTQTPRKFFNSVVANELLQLCEKPLYCQCQGKISG